MFTLTEARERFEERFPEFQNKAKAYFQDYKPEAKDEAVANASSSHGTISCPWSRTARRMIPYSLRPFTSHAGKLGPVA